MATYTVKQIAEMLDTNPETVRRWIRDEKLKAVQVSRKDGNVVTGDELQRFLKASPKYFPKVAAGLSAVSPVVGLTTLAGGLVAGTLISILDCKRELESIQVGVLPDDLKAFITKDINDCQAALEEKQALIEQTEKEIRGIQQKIEQYQRLIDSTDASIGAGTKIITNEEE